MSPATYNKLPNDPKIANLLLESENTKHRQDLGWLGRCFGAKENLVVYVVGFVCILLVGVSGLAFCLDKETGQRMFEKTLPVITVVIGYLLGHGSKAK
jgi:hypothetical protein